MENIIKTPNRPQILYLPQKAEGQVVLHKCDSETLVLESDSSEGIFNFLVRAENPGNSRLLQYRCTKDMADGARDSWDVPLYQEWNTKVRGTLSDGWLEVVS